MSQRRIAAPTPEPRQSTRPDSGGSRYLKGTAGKPFARSMYARSPIAGGLSSSSQSLTRLLFVDDDPLVRKAFIRAVSAQGFLVDVAATPREGLELFRRGAHPVVVTDLSMPGGSGMQLLRDISGESTRSVFVVLTGVLAPKLPTDEVIRDRIVSLMTKPWRDTELKSTLQRARRAWKARCAQPASPRRDSKALGLLLVEDDDDDHEVFAMSLHGETGWEVTRVVDIREAVSALDDKEYDAVVSDLTLPDARGVDAVLRIRAANPSVPLVVLSNVEDEVTSLEAVRAGAHDFLLKAKADRETVLRTLRSSRERAAKERELRKLANEDPLTGLANRARFQERLAEEVARAERACATFGLMYLDLDGFKGVNDQLGHDAGDALLVEVGRRLSGTLREMDFAARLGGDEFAVILDVSSLKDAAACARRVLSALAKPYGQHSAQAAVTASIGLALFEAGESPRAVTKAADAAMYRAKAQGRNGYQFALARSATPERTLAAELEHAMSARQFTLHYQVQVDPRGRPQACEALLRWRRAEGRLSPPAEFLPLLEASGDIAKVGASVIRESTLQLARWRREGFTGRVTVNVSEQQLAQQELIEVVRQALREAAIPPACLELELTESALHHDPVLAREVAHILKQLGVRLALDDFGAGTSSLSALGGLPFDTLKIDVSCVAALSESHDETPAAGVIVAMGRALGMQIVAEGVETDGQRQYLIAKGCDLLQGFLFARPGPAESVCLTPLGESPASAGSASRPVAGVP